MSGTRICGRMGRVDDFHAAISTSCFAMSSFKWCYLSVLVTVSNGLVMVYDCF